MGVARCWYEGKAEKGIFLADRTVLERTRAYGAGTAWTYRMNNGPDHVLHSCPVRGATVASLAECRLRGTATWARRDVSARNGGKRRDPRPDSHRATTRLVDEQRSSQAPGTDPPPIGAHGAGGLAVQNRLVGTRRRRAARALPAGRLQRRRPRRPARPTDRAEAGRTGRQAPPASGRAHACRGADVSDRVITRGVGTAASFRGWRRVLGLGLRAHGRRCGASRTGRRDRVCWPPCGCRRRRRSQLSP